MPTCDDIPAGAVVPPECRPVRVRSVPAGPEVLTAPRRLALEALGDGVSQSAAATEAERWRQLVRSASTPAAPSWFRFLGGDMTDTVRLPNGDLMHIGCDLFAGTTITAADKYNGGVLPLRNGVIVEDANGFNRQLYASGNTGNWINSDQGIYPDTHYWPICAVADPTAADRVVVGAWLVGPPAAGAPWGRLLDSHIISISIGFGGAISATPVPMGLPDGPHILRLTADGSGGFYALAETFHPDYDPGPGQPVYGVGSMVSHHTRMRLARLTAANLRAPATWQWWQGGSSWVAGAAGAVTARSLSDPAGRPVRGDGDITRVGDGTWRLVGHQLIDSHVDVWAAPAPTGPWELSCRVRAPGQGTRVHGGQQIGQFARFVEPAPAGTPAEHSMVSIALNLLNATDGGFPGRDIRRFAPQFVVVPHYP